MRRVLIVDDSPALRNIVAGYLQARGWQVETAEDGEQGAIAALASPPDVVVSDLWMPGLSGVQLCQLLRGDRATAAVPVVLVTATGDRRSRFWGQRAGAHAFLDRADLGELARVLDQLQPPDAPHREVPDGSVDIRRSSIPRRLSTLLDRALFDAVVAGELRALASAGSDVEALFAGLTRLLSDLVDYGWLALALRRGDRHRVYVHQHADAGEAPAPGVLAALGLSPGRTVEARVVTDTLPSSAASTGQAVVHPIALSGGDLGTLALAPARRAFSRDEEQVIALAAREVALPVHAVALLEESRRLAATDPLTGLANRRQGTETLAREVLRYDRYQNTLVVALLDVDHFKQVNDAHGHAAGDRALCHVADVLRAGLRTCDLVARWGGEEFLVVLPDTSRVGARVAAERLRAAVARASFTVDGVGAVRLTVSVGLAACAGQGMDRLLDEADRALYRAKARGRNRVEFEGAET